jgi:ABC-type antimicrobial peptide transport system permease subunit
MVREIRYAIRQVMRTPAISAAAIVALALLGLVVAAATASLIAHFIFGLDARDPATFAATAVTLVAAGGLASYLPARRAARVDPLTAIRCD